MVDRRNKNHERRQIDGILQIKVERRPGDPRVKPVEMSDGLDRAGPKKVGKFSALIQK
jgi:hypothetical protein